MSTGLGLDLKDVSVKRGARWVLRDVSLALAPGERWALVGGNGAGKTQLLKLLAGDVWPTPTGREARVYQVRGRPLELIEAKPRIAYLGAELQDKYARYGWNLPVGEVLATGLHRTDLLLTPPTPAEQRRVARMLARCGLDALRERRFSSLSYGEKRLTLLARALVQDPDWLLLDEFYNGLDTHFRGRVDAILQGARAAGQSWVAASHRAADVPRGTSGVIELAAGRVRSTGFLNGALLERLAKQADEPASEPAPRARRAAGRSGPGSRSGSAGQVLVDIARADLYVDYRRVLEDVNWTLRKGEHWAVFGANGAGKSSFLKLLYGDLAPALGGTIRRRGFPRGSPISAWKHRVGYVSPELQTDYAVDATLLELVASGRYASIGLAAAPTAADLAHARRWLDFFALLPLAARRPRELSYGQLRRALFARALAGNPRILLLDEPLTGLDPRQRAAMKRLLGRLMNQGRTVIMAVHHAEDLPRGVTHVLNLREGRAVCSSAT